MMNAHYVPRFLTRPWELDARRLVYFDFCAGDLRRSSSKKVLARFGLNSAETDAWFSRLESRAAASRDRLVQTCRGRTYGRRQADDLDDLVALSAFQLHRSGLALLHPSDFPSLEMHKDEGPGWVELVARAARLRSAYFLLFDEDQLLHFPACGFFGIPGRGDDPGARVFPLTPCLALVEAPRATDPTSLAPVLESRALMTILSVGYGPLADRVLIPPALCENFDDATVVQHMLELRAAALAFGQLRAGGADLE